MTLGQYVVAYEGERCLGGAVIETVAAPRSDARRQQPEGEAARCAAARYNWRLTAEIRMTNSFRARSTLTAGDRSYEIFSLAALPQDKLARLPYSLKMLLENLLRFEDGVSVTRADIEALLEWDPAATPSHEIAFTPARVILQDFTGVPCVVDLAAMRDAIVRLGGDAQRVNPLAPAELVIDHSVQVDEYGFAGALAANTAIEFARNRERYAFLRWGQTAFRNFSVVPPNTGIVHQVNLEYLGRVIFDAENGGNRRAYPDTLVGTDSHTTMINGLGVLGWGVGGIEAEAAMLGQPVTMLIPQVIGFRLEGQPAARRHRHRSRAHGDRDAAQARRGGQVRRVLRRRPRQPAARGPRDHRQHGARVRQHLRPVPDRQRDGTLPRAVRSSARAHRPGQRVRQGAGHVAQRGRDTCALQRRARTATSARSSPAWQDRAARRTACRCVRPRSVYETNAKKTSDERAAGSNAGRGTAPVTLNGKNLELKDGAVLIAAITSCTNTSNPSVMLGAGLLARNAVQRGLTSKPWVKTSLAPGSRVVTDYFTKADVLKDLAALGFDLVGYGCTTCIAQGTPVLMANGTSVRIEQLPTAGGARVIGPTKGLKLAAAVQAELMVQGSRDCVHLALQDGRVLACTPDHKILCADGRWVRADQLRTGKDRVVIGLEAPVDEPGADEVGYELAAGHLRLNFANAHERARTLAFARMLGHLLSDGSISRLGQGRMNLGQALDREVALNDVELVTGKRPAASRYDERKWSMALPMALTEAIMAIPGVRTGKRIEQPHSLPEFVLQDSCPLSIVREFLAALFGADGHGPVLKRSSPDPETASLSPPAYSQSAKPENVKALKTVMGQVTDLLVRCGVKARGAQLYTYAVRRSASTYPSAQDGVERTEVRLQLPHGLSFAERVGFRYCVDKSLRLSAAAVYWRTVDTINRQRLWMADRLELLHEQNRALSFRQVRAMAAAELVQREVPVFAHYSLLEGHDRFDRLPRADARPFKPLHRDTCSFPSPVALMTEIGARDWFARLQPRAEADASKHYCVDKDALELPSMALTVKEIRPAGKRPVFDIAVNDLHAFVAGGVAVHNCIGNSGPLKPEISAAVKAGDLTACAVLSGNRNFEGRVHPEVRMNFLASPPLVVAYALAGTLDIDLTTEPLGTDKDGKPVIWPTSGPAMPRCRMPSSAPSIRRCSGTATARCSRAMRTGPASRCRRASAMPGTPSPPM